MQCYEKEQCIGRAEDRKSEVKGQVKDTFMGKKDNKMLSLEDDVRVLNMVCIDHCCLCLRVITPS